MSIVTRDATSGWWVPASGAEWTSLLSGTSLAIPNFALHGCGDASDPITDAIGTDPLGATGGFPSYHQAVAGWSRLGFSFPDNQPFVEIGSHAAINQSTLQLVYVALNNVAPSSGRTVVYAQGELRLLATGALQWVGTPGGSTYAAGFHPILIRVNQTALTSKCFTELETIVGTYAAVSNAIPFFGGAVTGSAAATYLYGATWNGAAAEYSDANIATLQDRLKNGPAVTSIAVTPTSFSIAPLATQQMTATATRADGSTYDCTATATWLSSDPTKATVSATGLVTGVAAGTANITASFTSFNASIATSPAQVVTVASGAVVLTSIAVTPGGSTITLPGTQQMVATGTFSDTHTSDLTSTATWVSSIPGVATVSATGLVTGISAGVTNITASLGLIVSPPQALDVISATNDSYGAKVMRHMLPPPYKQDFNSQIGKILTVIGQSDNIIGGLFGADDFLPDEG